jgi:hypothetical protein
MKLYLQEVYKRLEQFDDYGQFDLVLSEVCENPTLVDQCKRLVAKQRQWGHYPRKWVEKAIEALK